MADPRSASLLTQAQQPSKLQPFGYGPAQGRPLNPPLGYLYYDTTYKLEYVFVRTGDAPDAVGWVVVGPKIIQMVGFGTQAQRPSFPPPGYLWFDTDFQQLFAATGLTSQGNATNWIAIGPTAGGGGALVPVITSLQVASAVKDSPFSFHITATNTPSHYNVSGELPPGVDVNTFSPGLISGTPRLLGTFTVTQEATNASGTGKAPLVITVAAVAAIPTITSPSPVSTTQGAPFTYQITATGTPFEYLIDGTLPDGLTLNSTTGVISGTPTVAATFNFLQGAHNVVGIGAAPLSIVVTASATAPHITSGSSATATKDSPFTFSITATNAPTSYSVIGSLPPGLNLNTATGVISGTPTTVATYSVTQQATNAVGTNGAALTITVNAAVSTLPAPVITSPSAVSTVQNVPFSYQTTASNFPTSFSADAAGVGGLPAGLSFNTATGVLSGTPTSTGLFNLTLGATNATGTGTSGLALTVAAPVVPSVRFRSVNGIALCDANHVVIIGAIVDTNASSTLTTRIVSATGGELGSITWSLVGPNLAVIHGETTAGGETSITYSTTTTLAGGYTLVVSTVGTEFIPNLTMEITGPARFMNGSCRGQVKSPSVAGSVDGFAMQLVCDNIDPSTKIGIAQFTASDAVPPAHGPEFGPNLGWLQPPDYNWDFNGDTVHNPKTDWPVGVSMVMLIGKASGNINSDCRLEIGP